MRLKSIKIILILLFISSASFAQWVKMAGTGSGLCFAVNGNSYYTGAWFDGVHRSTDSGQNWIYIGPNAGYSVRGEAVNGNYIFAGTDHSGVFVSSNNGSNWISANNGLTSLSMRSMASNGNYIFAASSGVFLSTNNGALWIPASNGLTNTSVWTLVFSGNKLYAGTFGGVFVTTNNGILWAPLNNGLSNLEILSLVVSGYNLVTGTRGGGAFSSSDGGNSWNPANNGLTGSWVRAIGTDGVNLFAGVDSAGIFYSSDFGQSWQLKNDGFDNNNYVYSMLVSDNYIYLGTGNGVWRRPISEITGVTNKNSQLPETFKLYQNYPNPFNPGTKIKVDIPAGVRGNLNLIVYNVLGEEVARLINSAYKPGTYEIQWDASGYPSGIYFYKLNADGFSQTKKMILIK